MTSRSVADSVRLKLNLKNLRRHDETITEIVESTSYVVLYRMGEDGSWAKTNIEGPMFLFKRSVQPFYGFFVLNRQGLEYVQEDLTPDSSVELMGDFIAFEPGPSVERVHGIWCYEADARESMCSKMEELRMLSVMSPTIRPRLLPYNQSIPIDLLFASPVPAAAVLPAASSKKTHELSLPKDAKTGINLLDSIFASAAAPKPMPPPPAAPALAQAPAPVQHLPLAPQPTRAPIVQPPTTKRPIFAPPLLSHDVFDLYPLVLKKAAAPVHAAAPAPAPAPIASPAPVALASLDTVKTGSKAVGGGVGGGTGGARGHGAVPDAKNVGIKVLPQEARAAKVAVKATAPAPPLASRPAPAKAAVNGHAPANGPSKDSTIAILEAAVTQAGVGMEGTEPLDKGEFVRSVLALLYTPGFSTALYADYVARFSQQGPL